MYYFWFVQRYYRANAALQPKGLDDDRTTTQPATVEPLAKHEAKIVRWRDVADIEGLLAVVWSR